MPLPTKVQSYPNTVLPMNNAHRLSMYYTLAKPMQEQMQSHIYLDAEEIGSLATSYAHQVHWAALAISGWQDIETLY